MIDLKTYLEDKIQKTISSWNEDDIYAISFFVYTNEENEYNGCSNVTEFFVSYNTEKACKGAGELSEERWNYAFWQQNETPIISTQNESIKILFDWYEENGVANIGFEDSEACYDENMLYIGKGPIGCYELVEELISVANNLHDSGFIKNKFGKPIPIIIHDLEYPWYIIEATKKANPNGEANTFLDAMKKLGFLG